VEPKGLRQQRSSARPRASRVDGLAAGAVPLGYLDLGAVAVLLRDARESGNGDLSWLGMVPRRETFSRLPNRIAGGRRQSDSGTGYARTAETEPTKAENSRFAPAVAALRSREVASRVPWTSSVTLLLATHWLTLSGVTSGWN
jgi:hypothetical protein